MKSSAIVSSLFPSNVRARLYDEGQSAAPTPKGKMKSFISDGNQVVEDRSANIEGPGGRPIADLFPSTTVMFGDIAGFTAWSSSRSPEQVFTLLQTIYQAFDKIALRRHVFKVETIGDSCEYFPFKLSQMFCFTNKGPVLTSFCWKL